MSDLLTVYVSIGNSDDKLPQARWHEYWVQVRAAVERYAEQVHGEWASITVAPFQNACICFDIDSYGAAVLKLRLAALAAQFGQDSIAWAVAETEFLEPAYE